MSNTLDVSDYIKSYKEYAAKHYERFVKNYKPLVLVVKTHWSTEYFDGSTKEALDKSCLYLLQWFHKENWIVNDFEKPEEPVVGKSVFLEMPDCSARNVGLKEWESYERQLNHINDSREQNELIEHTLSNNDSVVAYCYLRSLQGNYREPSVNFEPLQCPTGTES